MVTGQVAEALVSDLVAATGADRRSFGPGAVNDAAGRLSRPSPELAESGRLPAFLAATRLKEIWGRC